MYHRTRWTPEKIGQRLELIAPLVDRKQKVLRVENDSLELNLRPYQIMTIRLKESAA